MTDNVKIHIQNLAHIAIYVDGFTNAMPGDALTITYHSWLELRSCNASSSIAGKPRPWRNWRRCPSRWNADRSMVLKRDMNGHESRRACRSKQERIRCRFTSC